MRGSFLFLGTGSSSGVPMIGCKCPVCSSRSSKNKRLRTSALIEYQTKKYLLDVSCDFRLQALKYQIDHVDALLLTHSHYDHVGGLDELRIYTIREKRRIPCLLSKETLAELKKSFYYLFEEVSYERTLSVELDFQVLQKDFGSCTFQNLKLDYVSYSQKETHVNGYIFGDFAYISDIKEYTEELFPYLKNKRTLVLSALREESSPVHFNLDEAIAFAQKVNAQETYFTHIAHEIDYAKVSRRLPKNIFLAYDGLKLEFSYD